MAENSSNLFALLIGVDYYYPNKLPGGGSYGHLHGCVRDVLGVEAYLKTRLAMPQENILRLTASHGDGHGPVEEPALLPTYENIVAGFERVMEMAGAGDQVIVHYSGHGGRAKSIYDSDVKSGDIDEALVPTDIGAGNGRYLRDLELAYLLKRMTDQGLIVTVVLDACHSGGMTRGDAVARGIAEVDKTDRPAETLAAPDSETLLATWQGLTASTRSASLTSGGLPADAGWVLLAACRPQELAYEKSFDGEQKSGALTYWLLETLAAAGPGLSYQQLHRQVLARVQSHFARQRPQLYGDGSRVVFGHDHLRSRFTVPVLNVNSTMDKVVLDAGIEQGVRRGARFALFPAGITGPGSGDFDQALAHITVTAEELAQSMAGVDELSEGAVLEVGAEAVLYNPGSINLRSIVLLQADGEGAVPHEAREALRAAKDAAQFGDFLQWAGSEGSAEFIVAANEEGQYEIWDAGGEIIPRINPPLALDDEDTPAKVIERLIHLTRYRNVQQLANNDSRQHGVPGVTFEWLDVAGEHTFAEGEEARLLVRNDSKFDVEITILELAPDWRITQLYPEDTAESYTFTPGEEDILEFDTYIDGDADEESSQFKLFATVKGTNFRMLELPSLDAPMTRGVSIPGTELEALLAQAVETAPPTRAGRLRSSAVRQWTTASVDLHVRR